MRRKLVTGLAAGLLVLGVGACGGDDGEEGLSGEEKKAAESLAASMKRTTSTEADLAFSTCVSEGVVDELGTEKLEQAGLLDEEGLGRFGKKVDRATAEVIGDVSVECYDFAALVEDRKAAYPQVSEKDWESYIACVDKLDDQLRASVVEANLKGAGQKAQAALNKEMTTCGQTLAG